MWWLVGVMRDEIHKIFEFGRKSTFERNLNEIQRLFNLISILFNTINIDFKLRVGYLNNNEGLIRKNSPEA